MNECASPDKISWTDICANRTYVVTVTRVEHHCAVTLLNVEPESHCGKWRYAWLNRQDSTHISSYIR